MCRKRAVFQRLCPNRCDIIIILLLLFFPDLHRLGQLLSGTSQIQEEGQRSVHRLSRWNSACRCHRGGHFVQGGRSHQEAENATANGEFIHHVYYVCVVCYRGATARFIGMLFVFNQCLVWAIGAYTYIPFIQRRTLTKPFDGHVRLMNSYLVSLNDDRVFAEVLDAWSK